MSEHFFLVPYSEVLPEPVQWFWETVEEGEIPFVYVEAEEPRLDGYELEDADLKWVLSADADDRVLFMVAVIAVDRAR
jgi:hypothetical protein